MNFITYSTVPSAARFQKDSSITFAIRKEDTILVHIDWLLEKYERWNYGFAESKRRVILVDLFMTCNFWIKSYHSGNTTTKKERYPAVLGVFEVVVKELCDLMKCNRPALAMILGEMYGHDMHQHGIQVDYDQGRAKYLDKLERKIYRLRFRGGLAYQYTWWNGKHSSHHLVPAESKRAYTAISRKGADGKLTEGSKDFGCFVMTVEREVYMAKPDVGDAGGHNGMFHSSFTSGDVVTMAGTMLIKHGSILGVRADSGHYKPGHMNMALFLQGLAMYGVDLSKIRLYSWDGFWLGGALEFLSFRMSWEEFEKTRRAERQNRQTADGLRVARGGAPLHPRLPGPGPALPPRPGTVQQGVPLDIDDPADLYQT